MIILPHLVRYFSLDLYNTDKLAEPDFQVFSTTISILHMEAGELFKRYHYQEERDGEYNSHEYWPPVFILFPNIGPKWTVVL